MPPTDPRRETTSPSRRRLLRTGAGSLATLAASSAGCLATLPPLGRRVQYGHVDHPEAAAPVYRRWSPDPTALQDPPPNAESDGVVGLLYAEPARMDGHAGVVPPYLLGPRLDYFGVGYENYRRVVQFGPAYAVEAAFDRASVVETVQATGYRSLGTHRGYDVFGRSDVPRTVAVGDGSLVFARGETSERDARAVVDAGVGAGARYHEVDATFAALTAAVGRYPTTWLTTRRPDHLDQPVPGAVSATHDGGTVYYVVHWLYPEGAAPSTARLRDELDQNRYAVRANGVDVGVDGRVAEAVMRLDHDAFLDVANWTEPTETHPQITWGAEYDAAAETLTVRHEAGERVDADRLAVEFVHTPVDGGLTQFAAGHDTVGPGDELTVDLADRPRGAGVALRSLDDDGAHSVLQLDYAFEEGG